MRNVDDILYKYYGLVGEIDQRDRLATDNKGYILTDKLDVMANNIGT